MYNVFIFPHDNTGPLLSHLVRVHRCKRVSGGCILMHAHVRCQLAEYRPWRRCCSMTCTDIEMTQTVITGALNMHTDSLTSFGFSPFLFYLVTVVEKWCFVFKHVQVFSLSCSFHTSILFVFLIQFAIMFSLHYHCFFIHSDIFVRFTFLSSLALIFLQSNYNWCDPLLVFVSFYV